MGADFGQNGVSMARGGRKHLHEKEPYEEEYRKALREFQEKYGWFGEGLETEVERKANKGMGHTVHFMRELPEYREIDKNYEDEERKIAEYRRQSQDEAFEMLKRYFAHLWN